MIVNRGKLKNQILNIMVKGKGIREETSVIPLTGIFSFDINHRAGQFKRNQTKTG